MIVKTNREKEFVCDWFSGPSVLTGEIVCQLDGKLNFYDVLDLFNNVDVFLVVDENNDQEKSYVGYTDIVSIVRMIDAVSQNSVIRVFLKKPNEE